MFRCPSWRCRIGSGTFRGRARQPAHAEAGVGRSGAGRRHRQRPDETRRGPRRLTRLGAPRVGPSITAPADERDQTFWGVVQITARDRSTVEHELALRPGCSAQARMPPTARPAPRGERRGPLVLTAGPVPYFYGRYPAGPVDASPSDWTRTVLALFSCARTNRVTGRPDDDDADRTECGGFTAPFGDARVVWPWHLWWRLMSFNDREMTR